MTNEEKIDVAKDFISIHKDSDVDNWQPFGLRNEAKYLTIYTNLINGFYGNVMCVDQVVSDNGDILEHGTEYQTEVSTGTRTGKAVVFTWYDEDRSKNNW